MSKHLWVGIPLLLILATGCGQSNNSGSDQVPDNAVSVHVTASNWKWTLDKTTFHVGVPIDFIVSSTEAAHGFSIAGTSISARVSQGDNPVHKVWTPTAPGTFNIACDYFCGAGHGSMYTAIKVVK